MPLVIDALTGFREALEREARSATVRMAGVWADATRQLDSELIAVATDVVARMATGRPITLWHIVRMQRYQDLIRQINRQLSTFPAYASGEVAGQQALFGQLGLSHGSRLLQLTDPGILMAFDQLNLDAIHYMVGNTGGNTPLGRLLSEAASIRSSAVARELVIGTIKGYGPEKIARNMRGVINMGLSRSITIARTETMRVYREATRLQYQHSGLVYGYRRVASKSVRTCIACLIADGQFYDIDEPFEEHPNGRCLAIPVTRQSGQVTWEKGEQWFRRQSPDVQREILGPGRYQAWRTGRFGLDEVVKRRENEEWGASLVVKPLEELIGG